METMQEVYAAAGFASDKGSAHSYIDWYADAFEPYRATATAVLEIGIFHGASLDVWRRYFPPATRIVGVDFNPHLLPDKLEEYANTNVHPLLRVDAYVPETVERVRALAPDGYDIIIDDGSHIDEHQVFVLREYGRLVKPGGLLVIEDVQLTKPNGHAKLLDMLHETMQSVDYPFRRAETVDRRNVIGRYDDILFVVWM